MFDVCAWAAGWVVFCPPLWTLVIPLRGPGRPTAAQVGSEIEPLPCCCGKLV